jgi:Fe-Mn family superoxide dismutase
MSHHIEFSELPYSYDALEPYIDARTMELHHTKHHRGYFDKFMAAIEGTDISEAPMMEVLASISKQTPAVRNNGGGFYNHDLFWKTMSPNGGGEPTGKLADALKNSFGSFEEFKSKFSDAAATRFGSGWAWLTLNASGSLDISSTPNQDNPLMDLAEVKGTPILGLDVWEHAYYLKYQNRRPEYIQAFWNVVNWEAVNERYLTAIE